MENKTMNGEVSLSALLESVRGIRREFGSFAAYVDENMDLVVCAKSGWRTVYPSGTETWAVLCSWLADWDNKEARDAIYNFVHVLLFPTSVRVLHIDGRYIEDIVRAHSELTERMVAAGVLEEPITDAEANAQLDALDDAAKTILDSIDEQ